VSWIASNDPRVVGYEVCVDGGACSAAAGSPAVVTGLSNGTNYTFTVYGVDAGGRRSPGATTSPTAPAASALPAPTGLAATAGDGTASLRWDAVATAASYDVLVDGSVATTVTGATTAVLTGLTNGTPLSVTVRAVRSGGTAGAPSAAVSVTPRAAVRDAAPPAAGAGGRSGFATTPDGRFSVFGTAAQLEPSDTNSDYELYVRDSVLGTTSRLDPSAVGTDLNASKVSLSDDGRFVVLVTSSAKVASDTNGKNDVYRLDRQTGTWQLVSVPVTGGVAATAGTEVVKASMVFSTVPSIAVSADGGRVFFFSSRPDLVPGDTNGKLDLFRKDMATGEVVRVSVTPDGAQFPAGVVGPALDVSPDGRFVLLVLRVQNSITALWRKDLSTGELLLVSGTGGWGDVRSVYNALYDARDVSISDDGRYVAFSSDSTALTSSAIDYLAYRKDMATGQILRAGAVATHYDWEHQVALDPTGRYVFFQTAGSFGADQDGHTDWYRRDLGAVGTEAALVTSRVDGRPSPVRLPGRDSTVEYGPISVLSANLVVVATMQSLVPADTNGVMDLYRKDLSTGTVGSAV
jgi:Tol biopolymer transport system component